MPLKVVRSACGPFPLCSKGGCLLSEKTPCVPSHAGCVTNLKIRGGVFMQGLVDRG